MELTFRVRSPSEDETLRIGRLLGGIIPAGTALFLSGDLGTGKTVFVRGLASAFGFANVRSPSFTLVNEYRANGLLLVHADLYRLDASGVDELELEEYLDAESVLLLEWAERWPAASIEDVIEVSISSSGNNGRVLVFTARGPRSLAALEDFKQELARTEVAGF